MKAPRRVRYAIGRFGLDRRRVLDLGCGPGAHLVHFGVGSVGLELDRDAIRAARTHGLDVRRWNFVEPIPGDLHGAFGAVWASNVFEHVLSPHEFLIEIRKALAPGGIALIVVPLTRLVSKGPWRGYLAADHVSFFTRRTARLTIERAGYRVVEMVAPSAPIASRHVGHALTLITPNVLIVAELVEDFAYPDKAHKILVDGEIRYKSE